MIKPATKARMARAAKRVEDNWQKAGKLARSEPFDEQALQVAHKKEPPLRLAITPGEDSAEYVDKRGRIAFKIIPQSDGSLEIRGVDTYNLGKRLMCERLVIRPNVGNSINVTTSEWNNGRKT